MYTRTVRRHTCFFFGIATYEICVPITVTRLLGFDEGGLFDPRCAANCSTSVSRAPETSRIWKMPVACYRRVRWVWGNRNRFSVRAFTVLDKPLRRYFCGNRGRDGFRTPRVLFVSVEYSWPGAWRTFKRTTIPNVNGVKSTREGRFVFELYAADFSNWKL